MDLHPTPPIAVYHPTFIPLSTGSTQIPRVDKFARLLTNEHDPQSPSLQRGQCTDSAGLGYTPFDETAYVSLDTIVLTANQALLIHALHAFSTTQAVVELIAYDTILSTTTFLLMGGTTESSPTWSFPLYGAPIEFIPSNITNITLRIKGLRPNRTGQATGRILARLA